MPSIIEWEGKKLDVDWHLNELDRVECEESLSTFLQMAWPYCGVGSAKYVHGWAVDAIAEHLEAIIDGDIRNLIINMPPRCLKSTLCSVVLPAFTWCQELQTHTSGPGVRFMFASYSYDFAIRDSVNRRRLIKSTWFRRKWGNRFDIIPDQDQKVQFGNDKGGESLITAVSSGVTGKGFDVLVADDPNSATEIMSDAVVKATNEDWWEGAMSTRRNDPKKSARIIVQQRLGEKDLTGHILDKEGEEWTHLVLPMEFESSRSFVTSIGWKDPRTEEGELLWPGRFDYKTVRELERNLTMWRASGQLQQRPEPQGGGIIKRDWWQVWPPGGAEEYAKYSKATVVPWPENIEYVVAYLDTAYTEKTMNDPSAMTVWGVFAGHLVAQSVAPGIAQRTYVETSNNVILLDAWEEYLEIHALVNKVHKTCVARKVDLLLIEDKAAGHSVAQELRRLFAAKANYGIRVMRPTAGAGATNNSKVARLYSVQNIFEEGMVYATEHTWAEKVISQVATFPNAQHDDLTDTVSGALRFLRDSGMLTRGEERMREAEEAMRHRGKPLPPLYPA